MSQKVDFDLANESFNRLNTDDSIASAHGILCGFSCVKKNVSLDDWLNEVLVSADLNNVNEKQSHQVMTEIFNSTTEQLADPTLNFWPLLPGESCSLSDQANSLVQWCQGFLVGLGLSEVQDSDEEVMEMIKDINEIAQLEVDLMDDEDNAQDLNEIIEFVRIGVLFIQETLQPSKQDFINPDPIH